MANIRGIELASEIYDLEDTSARSTATTASQTATAAQTTATQAQTTATQAKVKAGDAYNTAYAAMGDIGDVTALETTDTSDLVSAINEINGKLPSIRIATTGPGEAVTIEPESEVNAYSARINLANGEIPIGVSFYDAAYGDDAQNFSIKGIRIITESSPRQAYVQFFVANISSSAKTVRANASIVVAKNVTVG